MGFHDSVKSIFFSKHENKIIFALQVNEFKIQDDSKVLSSNFQGLKNFCSLIDLSSLCNLTGLNSIYSPIFPKSSWSWWFDHQWHQNDQYQTFCVEWIIKNPNFYWYMVLFLSEAVEASLCYFFKNWLVKLKFPNLRNIQIPSNKI